MESIQDKIRILNPQQTIDDICSFIHKEISENFNKFGAVIGLSGGIDSALTATLCKKALGEEKILGIIMPEKESDSDSEIHAKKFSESHNIKTEIVDITQILESFGVYEKKENIIKKKFPNFNSYCKYRMIVPSNIENVGMPFLEILDENNVLHKLKVSSSEFLTITAATSIKHRVRMTMLYFFAEKNNYAVIGTTNKSEYLQGYFVKYGDGGSDVEPIVDLYKSQVYQLGEVLKVSKEIISKDASPDVWSFSTSDKEFFYSVPYDLVDLILYARENKLSNSEIHEKSNLSIEEIEKLVHIQNQKERKSQHMRDIPHGWKSNLT